MTTDSDRDRQAPDLDSDAVDPDHADQQDFAIRNVMMSNAFPTGGQPAAGAVIGSAGRLGMQPETDEETVDEADESAAARKAEQSKPRPDNKHPC